MTSTGPESDMTNVCNAVEESFDGKINFLPIISSLQAKGSADTYQPLPTFMCSL